ncbi:hypothetical protein BQ8482_130137 [Mesorhizobium delmotii]|uniref:Uncharacterized protein n=1 Tax=Mesorhizobium delmotii TaxID=1631247 RepID=A0A2P9AGI5_9HYPH|nr:hypothetical protein BQ8482_130137 [Mesorhizobium delmotii]
MNRSPGIVQKTKDGEYMAFADLAAEKTQGVDYDFVVLDRASAVAIVAPHGGLIEYGTSQMATAVAADDFSLYLFEGLKPKRPHRELRPAGHQGPDRDRHARSRGRRRPRDDLARWPGQGVARRHCAGSRGSGLQGDHVRPSFAWRAQEQHLQPRNRPGRRAARAAKDAAGFARRKCRTPRAVCRRGPQGNFGSHRQTGGGLKI